MKLFESLKIPIGTNAIPNYQDLSLKLNFPLKNKGNISLFSLGGISRIKTLVSTYKNPEEELYSQKDRDSYFGTSMNVSGISYSKFLGSSAYLKMTLAGTFSESDNLDSLVFRNQSFAIDSLIPKLGYRYTEKKLYANVLLNKKINRNFTLQTGIVANEYFANLIDSNYNQVTYKFENRLNYNGNTFLIQPYITFKIKLNEFFNVNGGLHSQYLTLNKSTAVEPRIMVQYKPSQKHSIGFSYGMHSQMQPLYIYFYQIKSAVGNYEMHNKNLGFTRSNHYVLTYDCFFGGSTRFKAEAYFQNLYNVPVNTYTSSFSMLNQGMKRFYPDSLKNQGTGKNTGIELTLEKFFDKAYFFLLPASLYDSRYKGSDGIERTTDFNGNYILNVLAGKDFKVNDRKTFGIGVKATYSGGKHYTPLDIAASLLTKEDVFVDTLKNTLRFRPYFRSDIKVNYRVNSKKVTHELGLDLINVFGIKNILSVTYSLSVPGKTLETYQLGFLPLFYYKVDF